VLNITAGTNINITEEIKPFKRLITAVGLANQNTSDANAL
jgi:hypothetical protein